MIEERYMCSLEPSEPDDRDYVYGEHAKVSNGSSKKDYRDEMLPVVNQGAVGSCAAQTGAAIKEWQEYAETEVNSKKSAHFLYDNRHKDTPGMTCRDLMKIIAKKGIAEEKDWPYRPTKEAGEKKKTIPDKVTASAYKNRVSKYYKITSAKNLEDALNKHGPCLIAVPTYNYGMEMWKPSHPNQQRRGGHAMTVVGYDTNDAGDKRFIIRNSWGERWGDKGHTYMKYDDFHYAWEFWACIDHIDRPLAKSLKYRTRKTWSHLKKHKFGYGTLAASMIALAIGVSQSI